MVLFSICSKLLQTKKFGLEPIFLRNNQFLIKTIFLKDLVIQREVVKTTFFTYSTDLHPQESVSLSKCKSVTSGRKAKSADPYTISYLMNCCGLSREAATSASEVVRLKTPERPNSVLTVLKDYGFTDAHIVTIITRRPRLLLANPEKILLPKLKFFRSIGATSADLARTFTSSPTFFTRSLGNQIIPSYNFLKGILHSDEKVLIALRRSSWVFQEDHTKNLAPNIGYLRELQLPESSITSFLLRFPAALLQRHDLFKQTVTKVKDMGINSMKSTFVSAVHAFSISGKDNKLVWSRCYETYEKWGWSKEDILLTFRKHPLCMIISEKKITRALDFLILKMGWPAKMIAKCPIVLLFSLEKRIIPRCLVIQELQSKGLIKKVKLSTFLVPSEAFFLDRFVTRYKGQLPNLLKEHEYRMKMDGGGF